MASSSQSAQRPARRRGRGILVWVALLVLLCGATYAFVERPWIEKPREVPTETVSLGPITQVLAVNGRVVARESIAVRSAVSGLALEVAAAEGEAVRAGDLLVQLDPAQPRALAEQARAALEAGQAKQRQAQANADRAKALGENTSRSTREDADLSLTAATNEVSRLQAALDEATSLLDQYSIKAPLSGVVLKRSIDRGQLVDTQTTLFTIADLSQLLVETEVDELYSARISVGLKALLRPAGDSVSKAGSVSFAAPSVDPGSGGRAVKIAFDSEVDLPVGLTVNANIIVSQLDNALSVSRGAIVTVGTDSHVLVIENGIAVQRPIVFSDWPAERVVITEGLEPGDIVILDPGKATPGQAVAAAE